jgi:hypothetical protein
MQRARRDRSRLSWSFLIIFLGLAAATVCASHPPTHDHDMGHPPLCTDTSSPAMLAHDKPVLFPNGGKFPLPSKSPFSQVSEVALSAQLLLGLLVLPQDLSQVDTRTPVSPASMFLVVLRL